MLMMSKTTYWKGWSEYGLFIKNSEISILKAGLEELLMKLRSEKKWNPSAYLNANGTFTKKFWRSFTEQGNPLELPNGDLLLEHIGEKNTNGADFIPSFNPGYIEHHRVYGYVVILEHRPSLCTAAYATKEEALNEIKSKIDPCLPKSFPWKERFGLFYFAFRPKKELADLYISDVLIKGQTHPSSILILARNKFEAQDRYLECVKRHLGHIPLDDPNISIAADFNNFLEYPEIKREFEKYGSATLWQNESALDNYSMR